MTLSRRGFLRGASGAMGFIGAAAAMNKIFGSEAFAATLNAYAGYRALVAVFLLGGNDTNNVLVPLTSNGTTGPYDRYVQARPTVKLSAAELSPVTPAGLAAGSYGIHFKMPNVTALFVANKAAFVCNAGPLVLPLDKATYDSTPSARPENLFSHSDQQDAWASAIANPVSIALPAALVGKGPTGWGGRFADRIDSLNPGSYPEVVSFGGKPLLCVGGDRAPFSVGSSGALALRTTNDAAFDTLRDGALEEALAITSTLPLDEAYGSVAMAAITYAAERTRARDDAWALLSTTTRIAINTAFSPANAVADPLDGALGLMVDGSIVGQLYQVVRDIIAGAAAAPDGLGLKRQVFSAGFGGFDTHSGQRATQDALLEQLDAAIGAFQGAMEALAGDAAFGATPPQATLFTMSDFGRTLVENSDGGTDHAWGSHVLVVGSNVLGGALYGTFPNLDMSGGGAANTDTTDSRGRWIPTVSVEQVANTLAYWMGASGSNDRDYMFPNLMPYVAASPNGSIGKQQRLGFMTT